MMLGTAALLLIDGLSDTEELGSAPAAPAMSPLHVLGLGLGVTVSAIFLIWIFRLWSERTISGWTALIGITVHALILTTLYLTAPLLLLIYEGLVLLTIACSPIVTLISDRRLLRQLRQEDALRSQQALTRDPNNPAAHAILGKAYLDLGQYDDAVRELEAAIARDPEHAQTERFYLQEARARQRKP